MSKSISSSLLFPAILVLACGQADPLVLNEGLGAQAVEIRERIVEQAEAICAAVGPSRPMLSIAKARVQLSKQGLSCLQLTTPARQLGPLISPKNREEIVAPMAEWITFLGSPALPTLRAALKDPRASEGERHLAVWALARIVSERRPYPFGAEEARCLLTQWQQDPGAPWPGQKTLESFEPWPSGEAAFVDGDLFGPDPNLPAPFNQARGETTRFDEISSRELSGSLRKILAERSSLIREAWDRLRELREGSVERSPADLRRELGEAFAVIAVLRPEIGRLRENIEPWLADSASWPYDEDPVMAVLEAYGVEALLLIRYQLTSEDPELRRKLRRLLGVVAGERGADCLLRSWAAELPPDRAQGLLELRDPSAVTP